MLTLDEYIDVSLKNIHINHILVKDQLVQINLLFHQYLMIIYDDICGYGRNMEDTNINLDEL